MNVPEYSETEKKQLQADALEYILPHSARNADLAKGGKIFTAGEGCYVYDIHGSKYLDTFSSLLTTICGHGRPEMKQAVMEQMDRLAFFPNYHDSFTVPLIQLADKIAGLGPTIDPIVTWGLKPDTLWCEQQTVEIVESSLETVQIGSDLLGSQT